MENSRRIINRCPYYWDDDCNHPFNGIEAGFKHCNGNCYEIDEDYE